MRCRSGCTKSTVSAFASITAEGCGATIAAPRASMEFQAGLLRDSLPFGDLAAAERLQLCGAGADRLGTEGLQGRHDGFVLEHLGQRLRHLLDNLRRRAASSSTQAGRSMRAGRRHAGGVRYEASRCPRAVVWGRRPATAVGSPAAPVPQIIWTWHSPLCRSRSNAWSMPWVCGFLSAVVRAREPRRRLWRGFVAELDPQP